MHRTECCHSCLRSHLLFLTVTGTYNPDLGASVCQDCPPGNYCPQASSTYSPCSAGSFATSRQSDCTKCPSGSFNSQPGASTCQQCPPGNYCPSGSDHFLPCAAGSYAALPSQANCTLCAPGLYSELTGRTDPSSCLQCPPGRANPNSGGGLLDDSCQYCPPGSASNLLRIKLIPSVEVHWHSDMLS
jgi:hypothetical protein